MRISQRLRVCGAGAVLAAITALVPGVPAEAATVPDASVAINPQAYEGQRRTIVGSLFGRCAPGFAFAGLEIEVVQGTFSTTETGRSVTCDGQWHKQTFSTPEEGWTTGPATVTARLSVTRVSTGAPGRTGVQTREIYVRPGAKIELPGTAVLTADGVRLTLRARCDRPWVLGGFGVGASQGQFPTQAASSLDTNTFPTCDGALHSLTVVLKSGTGTAFKRGWIRVDAYLHTLDPEQFDPAPSATAVRNVQVG